MTTDVDPKERARTWANHREALRAARAILATATPDPTTTARLATCDWLLHTTTPPSGHIVITDQSQAEHHRTVGYQWAADLHKALGHGAVASVPGRVRTITARVEALEWALRLTSPPDNDEEAA